MLSIDQGRIVRVAIQGSVVSDLVSRAAPAGYAQGSAVYGLQPGAHAAIASLARSIEDILRREDPAFAIEQAVAELMSPVLATPGVIADEHRVGYTDTYRRHVLYADPRGRFTILSLVWGPGHTTPVHGHTAWGAVGVVDGTPTVELFECLRHDEITLEFRQCRSLTANPGDTCTVTSGLDDVHRIRNDTQDRIVTLHIYGRDLLSSPTSINITLDS
jgi:predicted metal-dependent enzyme (double-stranded beta helix superfamily)